jgi:murein DD-endopeptidase MepM/ murein hydrolase activator NlpD
MTFFSRNTFCCPIKHPIIEKYIPRQFSLSDPASGIRIISHSDSLVFPTMQGVVEKRWAINTLNNALIIRHNDTLLSVYSSLDTILVDLDNKVTINQPIGIANKIDKRWEIRFAIWNKETSLNTDNLLNCRNY